MASFSERNQVFAVVSGSSVGLCFSRQVLFFVALQRRVYVVIEIMKATLLVSLLYPLSGFEIVFLKF